MRVFSIGAIMPFPLGLYSIGTIDHAVFIGAMFEQGAQFQFLSIVFPYRLSYIWKQLLKRVPFFKTRRPDTLNKDTNHLQ